MDRSKLTSRSAIECYQSCPRKRYWNYHYKDIGIVPVRRNIALLQGIAVHKGIEYLLGCWNDSDHTESAVNEARGFFQDEGLKCLVDGKGTQTKEQQIWTIAEGRALVEAQVRLWSLIEFPRLRKYYNLVYREKEMTLDLGNDITLQSRLDAVFQRDNNYYGYSLKTGKLWDSRMADNFEVDLQTLTETYVASRALKLRVSATIFCHLIKGKRKENQLTGNWETEHPLIRGYRRAGLTDLSYAHSYWFPNPENPSGFGRLGKGWNAFNVWSKKDGYDGGIKQWIEDIYNRKIQPEIDPEKFFADWCVVPTEIFRSSKEIDNAMDQITYQERIVFHHLGSNNFELNMFFPQFRKSCNFPTRCEYYPICHGKDSKGNIVDIDKDNPLASGLYEIRVPHHELVEN